MQRPLIASRVAPALLGIALALMAPGGVGAGEAHYLLMFGSQRERNDPNHAHSFATFARVRWAGNGPCQGPMLVEAHTISWLPANLVIRTNALLPECGTNFDLDETLRFVLCDKQRVSLWGPYPVQSCLYDKALERIAELNSGRVRYKANDSGRNPARVSNCIHAISTTVGGRRVRVLSPGWGEPASYAILLRMRPDLLDTTYPHYWVSSALGLDAYPIIYRERIAPPRSGTFFGPVFRALGGDRNLRPTYGPPGAGAVIAPLPTALPAAP